MATQRAKAEVEANEKEEVEARAKANQNETMHGMTFENVHATRVDFKESIAESKSDAVAKEKEEAEAKAKADAEAKEKEEAEAKAKADTQTIPGGYVKEDTVYSLASIELPDGSSGCKIGSKGVVVGPSSQGELCWHAHILGVAEGQKQGGEGPRGM